MKKFILSLGICAMALSAVGTPVHAQKVSVSQNDGISVQISEIDNNTYIIRQDNKSETITLSEDCVQFASKNKCFNIIYDSHNNTLYSSLTKKAISFSNLNNDAAVSSSLMSMSPTRTYYTTKKISWHSIHQLVGNTADAMQLAAAILGIVRGLGVTETAASIVGLIGLSTSMIDKHLISNSVNHGLLVKIKNTDHYRIREGIRSVYKTDHAIASITAY